MKFVTQARSGLAGRRILAVAIGMGLGCVATMSQAQAITGGIDGSVPQGKEIVVKVDNEATGLTRILSPNSQGKYSTTGLAPGTYNISIKYRGNVIASRRLTVRPNVTSTAAPVTDLSAPAASSSDALRLSTITVSGSALDSTITPIDVSTPELVTNYNMGLINQLPIGRSPESVAVLQSNVYSDGTTTGSIYSSGATAAGNRFFLNGFDITNDVTSVGSRSIPADAIGTTSTIPGSASASWTTSTGGVLASTLRQGTNQFKAGYSLFFTPPTSALLEPKGRNVLNSNGDYYTYASGNNHGASYNQDVWASGALIRDKLFFFALLGNEPPVSKALYVARQYETQQSSRSKDALVNLTWNITDNQSLNVFASKTWSSNFSNYYNLGEPYDTGTITTYGGNNYVVDNDKYLIANYQYNITPNLSFSLMGGYLGQTFGTVPDQQSAGQAYVARYDNALQQYIVIGPTSVNGNNPPQKASKRSFSGKVNWTVGPNRIVLGGGFGSHSDTRIYGNNINGNWVYYNRPGFVLPNGATVPGNGDYVDDGYSQNGGTLPTDNRNAYLEDYLSLTDKVTLYGAVRYDRYNYRSTQGNSFMRTNMLSPRLGVSWDVRGDSTLKIGANLGKYGVPLPSNYSFGVAHQSLVYDNYYTYTGIDPATGLPTGSQQIGETYYRAFGIPPPADTISSTTIKPGSVIQSNVYAQMQLAPAWSGLVQASYSRVLSAIDQYCDMDIVDRYAHANGFPNYDSNGQFAGSTGSCIEFNPGKPITIQGRGFTGPNAAQQMITIPSAVLGIDGPRRKFYALTFQLNHQRTADQPFYLNLSYTWSHEYGNYDGLLDLDTRNGGYIGQTKKFAYPALQIGGSGNTAQDIPNNFVASGVYYFSSGFNVGAIFNAHNGAPLSCYGTYTADPTSYVSNQLGAASHFCNGRVVPLGSAGRAPFFWQLSLSGSYDWKISTRNTLNLQLQVFNVTNRSGITDQNQTFDQGYIPSPGVLPPLSADYRLPTYQAPRTVAFNVRYTWD